MRILFFTILFLFSQSIMSQTFYDMLRETMDSTYKYIIERNVKFKIIEKLKYNNIYEPYGYEPSKMLQTLKLKKKKYTYRYNLVGDYDMRLRKDTILIYSCGTIFHKRHRYKNKFWEARNRISNKKRPSKMCNNINELIFVYNKNMKCWKLIKDKIKPMDLATWLLFPSSFGTTSIGECIDHTLEVLKEHIISKGYKSKDILYIDNSFGLLNRRDICISSEQDMKKKDYKCFRNILGWISLDLEGDTLIVTVRNIDGMKYPKYGVERSLRDLCSVYFKYCDKTRKWEVVDEKWKYKSLDTGKTDKSH